MTSSNFQTPGAFATIGGESMRGSTAQLRGSQKPLFENGDSSYRTPGVKSEFS